MDTTTTQPSTIQQIENFLSAPVNFVESVGSTVATDVQKIASLPGTVADAAKSGINAIGIVPIVLVILAVVIVLRLTSSKNIGKTLSAAKLAAL